MRVTKVIQSDGDDNKTQVIEDRLDFTRPPLDQQHLDTPWTGITVFFEKDQDFMDDNDDDDIDENDEEHDEDEQLSTNNENIVYPEIGPSEAAIKPKLIPLPVLRHQFSSSLRCF